MKKSITVIISILALFLLVSGCTGSEKNTKYTYDGFTLVVPEEVQQGSIEGYTLFFYTNEIGITVLQYEFSTLEEAGYDIETLSEKGFLELFVANNEKAPSVKKDGSVTYTEYDAEVQGSVYSYLQTSFKGPGAMWIVTFYTVKDSYSKYHPDFMKWAKTITVK